MAIVYVGPTPAGSADGTSWANRYGSLNAAEDRPLAAGDVVYVAPGVYREMLTCDVSGSSGNPITFIADITGGNTDGIGGTVRVTGSDNDQTQTRNSCISASSRNYRTFSGFAFDMCITTNPLVSLTNCANWIIEDCSFSHSQRGIVATDAVTDFTLRRCVFMTSVYGVWFTSTSDRVASNNLVENCLFLGNGGGGHGLNIDRFSGMSVRNCLFHGHNTYGCRVGTAAASGQVTINNCIFYNNNGGIQGPTTAAIAENYNAFYGNQVDRSNTSTGANSNAFPPLLEMPLLLSGYRLPWRFAAPSEWSPLRAIAGTNEATEDLQGITRPVASARKSWGAVQFSNIGRETTTVRTGTSSLRLADATRHQVFVPTDNVSTTFSVWVRWEANYAGTLPRLIVKQPGQADQTATATGSAGTWEQLSITLTPAAIPGYVVAELVSSNTATSGNYAVYFDDLEVS